MLASVGFQLFLQDAGHRLGRSAIHICFLLTGEKHFPDQSRLCAVQIQKLCALLALCHHADYAAWHLHQLLYVRNGTDMIELFQRRILDFWVLLGYQTDSLVTDHGLLYSRNGFLAADIKADGHLRKHGKSAECYDRHRYNLCIFHQVPPK